MPEIKKQFTGGKMNKDVDERLVPNGEYRDAMNIQVSTSEGSAVGTVQNILGNKRLDEAGCNTNYLPDNAFTVGSISDEKNDAFYWLVSGYIDGESVDTFTNWSQVNTVGDYIIRYGGNKLSNPGLSGCEPVFVDKYAFSTPNLSTDNSVFLSGLSLELIDEISAGWNVMGVTSNGTASPVSTIISSGTTNAEVVDFMLQPSPTTTTHYQSSVAQQGNGGGFTIKMSPIFGGGWFQATNNAIYLPQNVSTTGFVGAGIEVLPYNIPTLLPANTTITAVTHGISMPMMNGTVLNFTKITLSNNLIAGVIANTTSSNVYVRANGNAVYNYNSSNFDIDGIITTTTMTLNPTGELHFPIFDVSTLSNNDPVTISGIPGCVGNIDVGANSITIFECGTANVILPPNAGTGPGQLTSGSVIFNNNIIVELDTPLDLSSGNYISLFFRGPRTLNFNHNSFVTGINIVDDTLFWTDGFTEPKKINIPRSAQGTTTNGLAHTKLVVNGVTGGSTSEEHITAIKKPPTSSPVLSMVTQRPGRVFGSTNHNFNSVISGDIINLNIASIDSWPLVYEVGDVIFLKNNTNLNTAFPITEFDIRLTIKGINGSTYLCQVLSIKSGLPFGPVSFSVDLDKSYDKLYRLKFPRFATRYKYVDGQYSSFSPFSEVAFVPGEYDYFPNKGYNLGMENKLRQLVIKNIVPSNTPADVVQVDVLYKESDSPSIYIVDEIKRDDVYWQQNAYEIKEEVIKAVVPSNQFLRSWDNLPRTALAQEVSGNRIIYGNYSQNYYLGDFRPDFKVFLRNRSGDATYKSIKSLRSYQVGVVYSDKYNRQTPVLSDLSGSISVSKLDSDKKNQLEIKPHHQPPYWATHHKFYIKETSSEFYNLSLDRYFDAEDGNIWLSFPSNDRNKVDLETSLLLKKRYNSNDLETTLSNYKIVDIKDEAPEFIKTRRVILGKIGNELTGDKLFEHGKHQPVQYEDEFWVESPELQNTILEDFHLRHNSPGAGNVGGGPAANTPLFVRITSKEANSAVNVADGAPLDDATNWYEIDNVKKTDNGHYKIKLKKKFGADAAWTNIGDLTDNSDLSTIANNSKELVLELGQDIMQNKAVFQGRFFVKIFKDEGIRDAIENQGEFQNLQIVKTANFSYLKDFTQEDITPYNAGYNLSQHNTKITAFNASGPVVNHGNYTYPNPDGIPIPTDAYCSHSVWQSISNKLDLLESRWVIDEAYAAGEEPFWGAYGFDDSQETQWYSDKSLTYGGYHSQSAMSAPGPGSSIPPTLEHNSDTNFQWGSANIPGLGHGADITSYEYHSTGLGVTNFTIDLSYVGTGRTPTHAAKYMRGVSVVSANGGAAWAIGAAMNWETYWQIANGGAVGDTLDDDAKEFANHLTEGTLIRFANDTDKLLYRIVGVREFYKNNYSGGKDDLEYPMANQQGIIDGATSVGYEGLHYYYSGAHFNRRVTYRLTLESVSSPGAIIGANSYSPTAGVDLSGGMCPIEIITQHYIDDGDVPFPENPAVFETEPKESLDLDIFHEISDNIPIELRGNENEFIPVGSILSTPDYGGLNALQGGSAKVLGWSADSIELDSLFFTDNAAQHQLITFLRPDGTYTTGRINTLMQPIFTGPGGDYSYHISILQDIKNNSIGFGWHNCYSYGNGVESNRIRDTFNSVTIDKGARVSATLDESYGEEHRKYGLIYSGLYNSTSGVNNLNQFITAEKITKDINPTYGSVQKLHSRDTDLIVLCEDKILKVLANKDAVYNADGNPQLTSTNRVLGQSIPFSGEYGISKNPESFASESYRVYFTDKVRGAAMRLSKDGLTPISEHGMKDWFRDNLKLSTKLIGSYDDRKDEYNITLKDVQKTVSFREDVRGWVSFKSFVPENAISCANEYYTFVKGKPWRHHVESVDRNTFHENGFTNSSVTVLLNDMPGSVKSFKTINYEGSQTRVSRLLDANGFIVEDGEYFNLFPMKGWFVESAFTDLEKGGVNNFIEKEGKWFGFINGDNVVSNLSGITTSNFNTEDFSIQGIGMVSGGVAIIEVYGCMDAIANNYDPNATIDDGSCIMPIFGCTDPTASNYIDGADTDDGSCLYPGCTDPLALNYNAGANIDDGSCIARVYGCMDPTAWNYYAGANTDNGSCEAYSYGCMNALASNYSSAYNTPCTDVGGGNGGTAPGDNNVCCQIPVVTVLGCTDCTGGVPNWYGTWSSPAPGGDNCDSLANTDDGSCVYCSDALADNYDGATPGYDYGCFFCTSPDQILSIIPDITTTTIGMEYDAFTLNTPLYGGYGPNVGIPVGLTGTPWMTVTETANNTVIYVGSIPQSGGATAGTNPDNSSQTDWVSFVQGNLSPGTEYNFSFEFSCNNSISPLVVDITLSTLDISGCTDGDGLNASGLYPNQTHRACNWNPAATSDDGSCDFSCDGCTDPLANNYDVNAVYDDGSCTYTTIGCMDMTTVTSSCGVTYNQYSNASSTLYNTACVGCCTPYTPGCTAACSTNYDPSATIDDGCCQLGPCPGIDHDMNQDGSVLVSYDLLAGGANAATCYSNTTSGSPSFRPDWGDIYLVVTDDQSAVISSSNIGPAGGGTYGYTTLNTSGGVMGRSTTVYNPGLSSSTGVASAAGSASVTVDLTAESGDGNCSISTTATYTMGCTDAAAINYGTFDITDNTQCIIVGCTDDTPGIGSTYWASNYSSANTTPCTEITGGNLTGQAGVDDNICCNYPGTPSVSFNPQNTSSGGKINQITFNQGTAAYQTAEFTGPVHVNEHLHGLATGGSGANTAMHVLGDPTDTLYATILAGQVPLSTTNSTTIDSGSSTYIPLKSCLAINPPSGSQCDINGHGAGLDESTLLSLRYTVRFSATLNNNISQGNLLTYDAVVGISSTDLTQNEEFDVGCKYDPNGIYSNHNPNVHLHAPSHCVIPQVSGCTDNGTQTNGVGNGAFNDLHPASTFPPPGASLNYNPLANVDDNASCCTHCQPVGTVTIVSISSTTTFVQQAKIIFTHRCEAVEYEIEVRIGSGAWDPIAVVNQPNTPSFNQSTPSNILLTGSALYSNSGQGLAKNIEHEFRVRTTCTNGSYSTNSVPNTAWDMVLWTAIN